jgi:hypothetical protein
MNVRHLGREHDWRDDYTPKPVVDVAILWMFVVAVRHARVDWMIVPRTATQDAHYGPSPTLRAMSHPECYAF